MSDQKKSEILDSMICIERYFDWRKNVHTIPFIKFPADWEIQIIGPFSGAQCRFRVRLPNGEVKSVYLDTHNMLGIYTDAEGAMIPYWEVFPVNGDTGRCDMDDIKELLRLIGEPR